MKLPSTAQAKRWDRARVARMVEPKRGWTDTGKKLPKPEVSAQDRRAKARRKAELDEITC
jgi:hypothetical protein